MSSMFAASIRKSSSSMIVSPNSSTSVGGLASAATGMRPTRCGASHAITFRSLRTSEATVVRWTFTTTCSPVSSVAAWTWAIEAAASGVSSNVENTSSSRAPRSCSTVSRTTSNGSAFTWSRHFLNSATSWAGNSPSPAEMIWPSLMYVGPERLGGHAEAVGDLGLAGVGVGELPSSLLDHPRCDGLAEVADHGDHARSGWQLAGTGEFGHLGLGLTSQRRRQRRPADVVAVEHPRAVIGERTPVEIRGSYGLGRCRSHPDMMPDSR